MSIAPDQVVHDVVYNDAIIDNLTVGIINGSPATSLVGALESGGGTNLINVSNSPNPVAGNVLMATGPGAAVWTNLDIDSVFAISNATDQSKKINFNLNASLPGTELTIAANQTGSLTLNIPNGPNASTLLTDLGTQNVYNKTVVSPLVTGAISSTGSNLLVAPSGGAVVPFNNAVTNLGSVGSPWATVYGTATAASVLVPGRTINSVLFDGSINITVPVAAGTLTGTTLAPSVVTSSLTSVGTLAGLVMGGTITAVGAQNIGSVGSPFSHVYATNLVGSAASAAALNPGATINGVLFTGAAPITIPVGAVPSVSVVTANGFAGTVTNPTTTPAVTFSTTVSGICKGDGTSMSAAVAGTDYSVGTAALTTGILKSTTASGALSIAVAADYPTLNQNTTGTAAGVSGLVVGTNGGTGVNNGSSTITLGANVTFTGTNVTIFHVSGATNLTVPPAGIFWTSSPTDINFNTTQPGFNATNSLARSNITGDGTVYTMIFNTVNANRGSIFDGVSTFTAPVTGVYYFSVQIRFSGLTASHTLATMNLVTTSRSYLLANVNPTLVMTGGVYFISNTILVKMTGGDTAHVTTAVSNGTLVVGIFATAQFSVFSGYLAV